MRRGDRGERGGTALRQMHDLLFDNRSRGDQSAQHAEHLQLDMVRYALTSKITASQRIANTNRA